MPGMPWKERRNWLPPDVGLAPDSTWLPRLQTTSGRPAARLRFAPGLRTAILAESSDQPRRSRPLALLVTFGGSRLCRDHLAADVWGELVACGATGSRRLAARKPGLTPFVASPSQTPSLADGTPWYHTPQPARRLLPGPSPIIWEDRGEECAGLRAPLPGGGD